MSAIPSSFLEVKLRTAEDFLKVKETLTRIGVASRRSKTLYQSCHILHKQGRYWIVSFKEMFLLDGRASTFSEEDRARRNTIALLLDEWGLVTIVDIGAAESLTASMAHIKVIPFAEKGEWKLVQKYTLGKR